MFGFESGKDIRQGTAVIDEMIELVRYMTDFIQTVPIRSFLKSCYALTQNANSQPRPAPDISERSLLR